MAPFLMMVLTQHVVLVCSRSTLRRASLGYLATTACIPVCIGQRAEHTHTDALVHRSVGVHVGPWARTHTHTDAFLVR